MKLFRSYMVLTLALLITLSASGITISLHKCCGSIQGFSLFGKAKQCNMTEKRANESCSAKSGTSFQKKPCCNNQQISLKESGDKTSMVTTKSQLKETKHGFDVLFFYTLFQNWLGSSKQQNIEKPSPGLFITEALILLLQQFRL